MSGTKPVYVSRKQAKRVASAMTHRYGLKRRRAGLVLVAAATRMPSTRAKVALATVGAVTYASGKRAQLKARKVAKNYVKQGKLQPQVKFTTTMRGATKFSKRRVVKETTDQYKVVVNGRQARKQQYDIYPIKRKTTNLRESHIRRDIQKKGTYAKMTRSQAARKAALARWGAK